MTDELLLGRDPVSVPHEGLLAEKAEVEFVSREHAKLSRWRRNEANSRVLFKDLGSSHGTVAKIARLGERWCQVDAEGCVLDNGDMIAFGTCEAPDPTHRLIYQVEITGQACKDRVFSGGA
jgi:hypothetical protein